MQESVETHTGDFLWLSPCLPTCFNLFLSLPRASICPSGTFCPLLIYTCFLYPLLLHHMCQGSRLRVCSHPEYLTPIPSQALGPRPTCDFPPHHSAPVQHTDCDIHPILSTLDSAVEPAANTQNPCSHPTHISDTKPGGISPLTPHFALPTTFYLFYLILSQVDGGNSHKAEKGHDHKPIRE